MNSRADDNFLAQMHERKNGQNRRTSIRKRKLLTSILERADDSMHGRFRSRLFAAASQLFKIRTFFLTSINSAFREAFLKTCIPTQM